MKTCTSCSAKVAAVEHPAESGRTWIWRCECGWASARTESGVVEREKARAAIARAIERLGEPSLASNADGRYGGGSTEET